jgi:CRISPR-associated protein Cas2
MVVMILENIPAGVRGELTRWLLELRAGVFVGKVSAMVREKLWETVCSKAGKKGGGFLIHPANTEQGYAIRSTGTTTKSLEDHDGLVLVCSRTPRHLNLHSITEGD